MNTEKFRRKLIEDIPGLDIEKDIPMSTITSFRVGGPADLFIRPKSREELQKVIRLCKEADFEYIVIGNGSNLLVRDGGIRGAVIQIYKNLNKIVVDNNIIHAESGALMTELSNAAYKSSLTGLEFAEGIPGTLGGAVTMNAGAYGGEMKDIISEVELIDPNTCEILFLNNDYMEFHYRRSIVQKKGYIIISAVMELTKGDKNEIKNKMSEYSQRRRDKQPLSMASAGSTFKRPPGNFAGYLIENSGLKGYKIGNAQVSEKHCGFIVNLGGATALEIEELIKYVQQKVFEVHKIMLEPEVKIIGER